MGFPLVGYFLWMLLISLEYSYSFVRTPPYFFSVKLSRSSNVQTSITMNGNRDTSFERITNSTKHSNDFVRKNPSIGTSGIEGKDQSFIELNEQLEKELLETKRKYQAYLQQTLLSKNISLSTDEKEFIEMIKQRELDLQKRLREEKEEIERRSRESRLPPEIYSRDNETLRYIEERLREEEFERNQNDTILITNFTSVKVEDFPRVIGEFLKNAYIGPPNPTSRQQDITFVFRSITLLSLTFGLIFTALFYLFPGKFVNIGTMEQRQSSPSLPGGYSIQNPPNPYKGKDSQSPYENQQELDLNQRLSKYRIFNYDADNREKTIIRREMKPIPAPESTTTAIPLNNNKNLSDRKILRMRPLSEPQEKVPSVIQKVTPVEIEKESVQPLSKTLSKASNSNLEDDQRRAPPPSTQESASEFYPTIQDYSLRSQRTPLQKSFLQQYLDTLKEELKDTMDL